MISWFIPRIKKSVWPPGNPKKLVKKRLASQAYVYPNWWVSTTREHYIQAEPILTQMLIPTAIRYQRAHQLSIYFQVLSNFYDFKCILVFTLIWLGTFKLETKDLKLRPPAIPWIHLYNSFFLHPSESIRLHYTSTGFEIFPKIVMWGTPGMIMVITSHVHSSQFHWNPDCSV